MHVYERPYNFNWSKNDIRYVFRVTTTGAANISGQVKIIYNNGAGDIELITLTDLVADANGFIYVYIQSYLNSLLDYTVPDMLSKVTAATSQHTTFFIYFREVNDSDTDPDWQTGEADHPNIVLKGGIELLKHSYNNFFINFFNSNKPFLTWLPSKRFVYNDQLSFLCFLNNTGSTSVGFKLLFTFLDTAGNTYSYTYTFTQNDILFHINVSPSQTGFPAFTNPLYYYDVQVTDSADVALTEAYRVYVEYRPVYEFWDLFWHNSLGGFDGGRVVGETTLTIDRSYTENGAGKDVLAIVDKIRSPYLLNAAITKRNSYKGDIGWQKNKEENEALQEILLSQSIYQQLVDLWFPVLSVQKSQDLRTTKSKPFNFPVQWQLASEEEVFTPKDRSFSVGIISIICDAVGFGTREAMPHGYVGSAYNYSVPLTGDPPFEIASIVSMPGGLNAIIDDGNLVIFGTPTTEGAGEAVNVVISNCSGNNTISFIDVVDVSATEGGSGTHWLPTVVEDPGDPDHKDYEQAQVHGMDGETIIITVTSYTNNNGGTLKFDGTLITTVGQTFTRVLDGSGDSAVFEVHIDGLTHASSVILGKFTITSATGGDIGSPNVYQIWKVF